MPAVSPYSTTAPFGRAAPSYVTDDAPEDLARVRAYDTYEDIFHNDPAIFKAVFKEESGQEAFRRLVPSARTIIEATNRYLANGLDWVARPPAAANGADPAASPDAGAGVADEAINATMSVLDNLFARESFAGKFMSLKRWMLVRGDALLHITADPSKAEGTRLTIRELNPGSYFPIVDPADAERVIGCYLVNVVPDDEGDDIVARLEYRRMVDQDVAAQFGAPLGSVFMKMTFWEVDGWDDRLSDEDLASVATPSRFNSERFVQLLTGVPLPAQITALPVYHFRNNARGGHVFGTSELQGIETLITGINQTTTDQELAVALMGLGVYWTTSGRPKDSAGNETSWSVAPASMLELDPDGEVGRLEGVGSVQASLDHIKLFDSKMRETTGTPEIAVGAVDVQVAESGVSRAIQFAPVIAKNAEKEEEIKARLDQMLFDLLTGWLPAYEGYTDNGVRVTAEFGPALPVNAKEIIDQVVALVAGKVVSAEWGRNFLTDRLGYQFSANEAAAIAAEASAQLDATGARLDAAVNDGTPADGSAPAA